MAYCQCILSSLLYGTSFFLFLSFCRSPRVHCAPVYPPRHCIGRVLSSLTANAYTRACSHEGACTRARRALLSGREATTAVCAREAGPPNPFQALYRDSRAIVKSSTRPTKVVNDDGTRRKSTKQRRRCANRLVD